MAARYQAAIRRVESVPTILLARKSRKKAWLVSSTSWPIMPPACSQIRCPLIYNANEYISAYHMFKHLIKVVKFAEIGINLQGKLSVIAATENKLYGALT
jgi:hypothetical protein